MKSPITSHVLDTSRGRPASGIPAVLEIRADSGVWRELARGVTDDDGRLGDLLAADHPLTPGVYRLTFDVAAYFRAQDKKTFYPEIPILFEIRAPDEHYHVPLLLSPYGYSTYRGS
jgi:5-hydroxyisourate hydrolase